MRNFHGFEIVPQSVGRLSWAVQAQLPTVGEMEQPLGGNYGDEA